MLYLRDMYFGVNMLCSDTVLAWQYCMFFVENKLEANVK